MRQKVFSVTVASGQSLSGAVQIDDTAVVGVVMPGTWTAAGVGFYVSVDGVTYVPLYDVDDAVVEIGAASASRYYAFNPSLMVGPAWVKVWSQTGGSGVNQGADREVLLVCRSFA